MKDKFFKTNFNAKSITDYLNKKAQQFKDLSPLMKVARVFMKNTVNENFETEGKHTGEKWAEWSDTYKKWRLKKGKAGGKILTLEGDLRRNIKAKSDKISAIVGTNEKYAALHNFGGNNKLKRNKTMKQRRFMRMDKKAIDNLYAELFIKAEEMILEDLPKN